MTRAAVLRDRAFSVEERPAPEPGEGQVLLKMRLCGICGSDLHLAKHLDEIEAMGREFGAPPQDLAKGLVMGHEFVGEIASFGPGTQQTLALGDRVTCVPFLLENGAPKPIGSSVEVDGGYAQHMLASEALLLRVPDDVPDAAAALVEPFAIAMHAVNKSGSNPAAGAALIMGCGPIGLAIANVLRMHGTKIIVASDFSPRRRELAATMGATVTVDPKAGDAMAELATQAEGRAVTIYDCTGANGVLGRTIKTAPIGARIVVAGIAHGEESINPMIAIAKELSLQFVVYYTPEEFAETLEAIAAGKLEWRPLVTGTVGLDAVGEAFKALEDPELHAKIMIDPWNGGTLAA
jgi:2-desacetyl-2-hydroxyethyl bacteriochlorophyllide A dehydrogenase